MIYSSLIVRKNRKAFRHLGLEPTILYISTIRGNNIYIYESKRERERENKNEYVSK